MITSLFETHATAVLERQLDDNHYDESELISIKVAAHLPYYTNSKRFERMDGEIEIDGVHYNYVKGRVYEDSLEYLCIPNKIKSQLSRANDDFFQLVNDIEQTSQKKTGSNQLAVKNLLTEYYAGENGWTFMSLQLADKAEYANFSTLLCTSSVHPLELPPDA
ncbi:MAG: hypothetical protein WKF70_12615 [Chitinophagaceae bacterium]